MVMFDIFFLRELPSVKIKLSATIHVLCMNYAEYRLGNVVIEDDVTISQYNHLPGDHWKGRNIRLFSGQQDALWEFCWRIPIREIRKNSINKIKVGFPRRG